MLTDELGERKLSLEEEKSHEASVGVKNTDQIRLERRLQDVYKDYIKKWFFPEDPYTKEILQKDNQDNESLISAINRSFFRCAQVNNDFRTSLFYLDLKYPNWKYRFDFLAMHQDALHAIDDEICQIVKKSLPVLMNHLKLIAEKYPELTALSQGKSVKQGAQSESYLKFSQLDDAAQILLRPDQYTPLIKKKRLIYPQNEPTFINRIVALDSQRTEEQDRQKATLEATLIVLKVHHLLQDFPFTGKGWYEDLKIKYQDHCRYSPASLDLLSERAKNRIEEILCRNVLVDLITETVARVRQDILSLLGKIDNTPALLGIDHSKHYALIKLTNENPHYLPPIRELSETAYLNYLSFLGDHYHHVLPKYAISALFSRKPRYLGWQRFPLFRVATNCESWMKDHPEDSTNYLPLQHYLQDHFPGLLNRCVSAAQTNTVAIDRLGYLLNLMVSLNQTACLFSRLSETIIAEWKRKPRYFGLERASHCQYIIELDQLLIAWLSNFERLLKWSIQSIDVQSTDATSALDYRKNMKELLDGITLIISKIMLSDHYLLAIKPRYPSLSCSQRDSSDTGSWYNKWRHAFQEIKDLEEKILKEVTQVSDFLHMDQTITLSERFGEFSTLLPDLLYGIAPIDNAAELPTERISQRLSPPDQSFGGQGSCSEVDTLTVSEHPVVKASAQYIGSLSSFSQAAELLCGLRKRIKARYKAID